VTTTQETGKALSHALRNHDPYTPSAIVKSASMYSPELELDQSSHLLFHQQLETQHFEDNYSHTQSLGSP
jgi:hypothetical protein